MHCYERTAMYLKLYCHAKVEIPDLRFEPELLDDVLCDCGIQGFEPMNRLNSSTFSKLIQQIWLRTNAELSVERRSAVHREMCDPLPVMAEAIPALLAPPHSGALEPRL